MMSPLDTRIVFFGGAFSAAALGAVVRLADAGYEVVACDHDPRESVVLEDAGIPLVRNRTQALEGAAIVLTSCQSPDAVEDLYLGENGLLELVEPGGTVIDLSISRPQLAREIQAMAAISELNAIDCPLLNIGEHEETVAFVGGDANAITNIQSLLPYLATGIHLQDAPGAGQLAAAVSIIGLAGSLMGVVEAMGMARVAGLSEHNALDALASTSAASRALVDYIPRVINYDYSGRMRVEEMLNALETALEVAGSFELTLPMVETAGQLYDLLNVVGGSELNIQSLALLYEDEKTCAEYGLDWTLVEEDSGEFPFDGFGMGFTPGPDAEDGPGGPGGRPRPPIGGFFSKN